MLQRVAKRAPGLARAVWAALPASIALRLQRLTYPIALGPRGGTQILRVPEDAPRREIPSNRRLPDGRPLPSVTIVIAAFAGRLLLEPCLRALLRNTPWSPLEILVIDDGMPEADASWLRAFAQSESGITALRNERSEGFARATNRGLRVARGEILVILNDDTVVGPEWLTRLVAHLVSDPGLGLVGACTNEIGNRAKVETDYSDFFGMERFAEERARLYDGKRMPMDSLALFCAAGPRDALSAVGYLDERYEVGLFEDDDLCLSLRRAGKRLALAEDAFVHHAGQASFGRLGDEEYLRIWAENRKRFEEKWQVKWSPPAK